MWDANANLFKMINCMKHVKIKMIKINAFVVLLMKNDYNNDFLLNCF